MVKVSKDIAFEQGRELQLQRRWLAAEACYRKILEKNPRHADALNGLGTLAIEGKKLSLALGYFEKAVAAHPKDPVFRNNLGNALLRQGEVEEAISHLEKVIRKHPHFFESLCNLGKAYRALGNAEKAEPVLRRALSIKPGDPTALLILAETLMTLGRSDEAYQHYCSVLESKTASASALYGMAMSRKNRPDNNCKELLQAAIDAATSEVDLERLHHAMAKTLIDLGEYSDAFKHLLEGKAQHKTAFNLPLQLKRSENLKSTFTPTLFHNKRGYGDPSEKPVFIVGMPRSGTSLAEQILASHPQVCGAGELTHIHRLANDLLFSFGDLTDFQSKVRELTSNEAHQLAADYLSRLEIHSKTATRITDKMPHNFKLLGFIAILFPNAKIVHCRRDPMDNCVSLFVNLLNEQHSYSRDLATLGRYYRDYVELMQYWKSVLPIAILDLQYESLVQNQEQESRRLVDFVGLPWDPACLAFQETKRTVRTISRWQVRQPMYATSVNRWKHFEHHLGPLRDALGNLVQ